MLRALMSIAVAAVVAACATPYKENGIMGGFNVLELQQGVWRVSFQGNGYTNKETVQTYWLYRSAQLALEQGYDGFEILSDMQFVKPRLPEDVPGAPRSAIAAAGRIHVPGSPAEFAEATAWHAGPSGAASAGGASEWTRIARGGAVFFYGGGGAILAPKIEGDIHLIKKPVKAAPPKVFDALALKAALEPLVNSEQKCGVGNVCPHAHEYLLPKGKLQ
jgi:hypothetical protein